MSAFKKITLCAAAFGLAAALTTACSSANSSDAKEVAEEANEAKFDNKGEKAADHLVDAYSGNMYEVKVSENASLNASDPEVKRIADMMVEAHTKMNVDVSNLASQKNVTLPSDLTEDQKKCIEKISEKSGMEYDKEYIADLKEKHEKTLKMLEKVSEKCDDPEIKNWATNSIPEVRHHLEMVNTAHENLKGRKS